MAGPLLLCAKMFLQRSDMKQNCVVPKIQIDAERLQRLLVEQRERAAQRPIKTGYQSFPMPGPKLEYQRPF
jgi:hypothetical protein